MKAKLGETVYTIFDGSITESKVGYIGFESFIVEDNIDKIPCSTQYRYDEYGISWFRKLDKAKRYLIKEYKKLYNKPIITQVADDYWEVEI